MQFAVTVPSIKDRVVQTAAKIVLEPIFEADMEPSAYGYRPKRSAQDAIRKVHKLVCEGYTDVVDADLSKYFDTIPHRELLQCVARRIVDRDAFVNLIWPHFDHYIWPHPKADKFLSLYMVLEGRAGA